MKILLIEDDDNKRVQLSQFLEHELPSVELFEERSVQSGLRRIRQDAPSLVLLDMTLPTYDAGPEESGGQTQIFGGRELLRQMDRFEINVPVIVITQFETFGKGTKAIGLGELDRDLRAEHHVIYKGSVYYHAAIHGWEHQLKDLIEKSVGLG